MVDIVDSQTRSRMMAGIRAKNTRPELVVRRFLHSQGFRYRLHEGKLPGKPDVVLPKYKLVIFVHGCFWHRHHGCKLTTCPENNYEKWKIKLDGNAERDIKHVQLLREAGWRVIVIWECSLRSNNVDLTWLPEYIMNSKLAYMEWPLVKL